MALAFNTSRSANSSGSTTPLVLTTFSSAIVVGQLIVLTIADDSGVANHLGTVSDSAGNVYTRVATASGQGSSCLNQYYAPVTVGGSANTVAVSVAWNIADTTGISVAAGYYNGFVGTPTLDQSKVGGPTSSTSPSSGATGTTINANELVIGGVEHAGTASNFSLGATYSNLIQPSGVSGHQVAQESKVVAATGTQTATFSIAASREWICGAMTFYDAVTGSTVRQLAALGVG